MQIAVVTQDGVELLNDGDEKHDDLKLLIDYWRAQEAELFGTLAPRPDATAVALADEEPPPSLAASEIAEDSGKG